MMNKKCIFLFIFFIVTALNCAAQTPGFRYGARIGLGESNLNEGSLPGDRYGKLAFSIGLTTLYQINTVLGIEADLQFVTKGTRVTGEVTGPFLNREFEEDYRLYYIQAPVMPKLSFGFENFYVKFFGGPAAGFNILSTVSREYDDVEFDEQNGFTDRRLEKVRSFEFTAIAGAGFDVETPEGIFSLDFRQSFPLSSLGEINGKEVENTYFTIGLGYLISR